LAHLEGFTELLGELGCARDPLLRVGEEGGGERPCDIRGEAQVREARVDEGVSTDAVVEREPHVLVAEQHTTREHEDDQQAERIDVGARTFR
jgi:hypothetical protein